MERCCHSNGTLLLMSWRSFSWRKNPPDVSLGFFPGNLLLNYQWWGPLPVICVCSPECVADAPQQGVMEPRACTPGLPTPWVPHCLVGALSLLRLPQKGYPDLPMGVGSWDVVILDDFSHTRDFLPNVAGSGMQFLHQWSAGLPFQGHVTLLTRSSSSAVGDDVLCLDQSPLETVP